MSGRSGEPLWHVRRYIRVIGIVVAAESCGLAPLPARNLHGIGYLADALAPVWGVSILDADILKRREGPSSPMIQRDVDRLVGLGILVPSDVRYVEDADKLWHLDAGYAIEIGRARPILDAARDFARFEHEIDYLREVVIAVSSLGSIDIANASSHDAAYSDKMVDIGGLISIARPGPVMNPSARVALRIGELAPGDIALTDAEKVHLYMRVLHDRLVAT
jgi:hypothetical protein